MRKKGWKLVMRVGPLLLLLLTVKDMDTFAASFDCGKAKTTVEKMICIDPVLSRLDEDLAKAYTEALARTPNPEKLRAEQRKWLKERYEKYFDAYPIGAGGNISDLKRKYEKRLGDFWPIRLNEDRGWNIGYAALARIKALPKLITTLPCSLDLVSGSKEFSSPPWQELPVEQNLDLIYAVESEIIHYTPKMLISVQ